VVVVVALTQMLPPPMVDAVAVVLSIAVNLEQVRKVETVRPMVQMVLDLTAVEAAAAWEARHRRPLL
jgi:hypothetical protein